MVNHIVVTNPENHMQLDIQPVFEAYEKMCGLQYIPSLLDIYGQYASMMEGRYAAWQAEYYPNDFYDGSPDRKPRRLIPDSMAENNPFQVMDPGDLQEVLERFCVSYVHRSRVMHHPVIEVW